MRMIINVEGLKEIRLQDDKKLPRIARQLSFDQYTLSPLKMLFLTTT